MSELLTAAQMRAIEQAAIESGEVTGLELMERAGQGVVEAIFEEWPEFAEERAAASKPAQIGASPRSTLKASTGRFAAKGGSDLTPQDISGMRMRAVVLCGPGNNGGDGFVVARLLHEKGWAVEVFLCGDAEKLPPDARVNYERWCALGEVEPYNRDKTRDGEVTSKASVFVDALFGTGLTRAVTQPKELYWDVHDRWGLSKARLDGLFPKIVSVDLPSGVCSDSGMALVVGDNDEDGVALDVKANLTVTFHREKIAHRLAHGAEACVRTIVKDIGLNGEHCNTISSTEVVQLVDQTVGFPNKSDQAHKFSHGHALILSGGSGQTGAARLAARGALRIGAGLVTLGVPPNAQQEVACQITALMLKRVADGERLCEVLQDDRLNALCLGPGMGVERARELVPVALSYKRATVLDADALSAFEDDPNELFELLHENVVLTPHGGEFARLFPDIAAKLADPPTKGPAYSKVDATREAAARAGCVVLFKGPDTVIASPNGQCAVNAAVYERAAPWLATAGSGDVLAGFITGLLARGFAPQQAAEAAAWLHVECARAFGPGLIAEDLPEMLPQVFSKLEA
ncbi:MAG: NAD(P)H-hydrate dehydratase [Shimia sp.]|uniref:NAD(P)H-hydrate dehydratase n=1 Tax=Shimia sp. TaxID=1954381 RepID=UPI001B02B36B|nr:NAD(P)H-hydrate dehydratase [Shimia sp.]MBO6899455.1 NAD(P)H-hydrate dehydratase [Shimia sp.]